MNRGVFGLLFAGSMLAASPAFAFFNVQVLGGQRNSNFDLGFDDGDDDLSGSELRFAAHIDPIPLVPIAFGLSYAQTTFDDKSEKLGVAKVDGTNIDLEVEAWLPLEIAGLYPFAKIGYTIGGEYKVKAIEDAGFAPELIYKPSGASLHVGVKYEFLMRLGVMAEVEFGTRKLEFDKANNTNGFEIEAKDADETSTSFLIGAQAGL